MLRVCGQFPAVPSGIIHRPSVYLISRIWPPTKRLKVPLRAGACSLQTNSKLRSLGARLDRTLCSPLIVQLDTNSRPTITPSSITSAGWLTILTSLLALMPWPGERRQRRKKGCSSPDRGKCGSAIQLRALLRYLPYAVKEAIFVYSWVIYDR